MLHCPKCWTLDPWKLAPALVLLGVAASSHGVQRAHTNPILILIQPAAAGPTVPDANYFHPTWCLWPAEGATGSGNRILAAASGLAWGMEISTFGFRQDLGAPGWRVSGLSRLNQLGYFRARELFLGHFRTGLVVDGSGAASRNSLVMAADGRSATLHGLTTAKPWPSNTTMVFEAKNWDSAASVRSATTGQVLVLEYPPPEGKSWSRIWVQNQGWPKGVPVDTALRVPGLVRAEEILPLVSSPQAFRWVEPGRQGPNNWLNFFAVAGATLLIAWATLLGGAYIMAALYVTKERSSVSIGSLLEVMLLAPAASQISGSTATMFGLASYPVVFVLALAVLAASATGGRILVRKWAPLAHPVWPIAIIGLIPFLTLDPVWSLWSGVFQGSTSGINPRSAGAVFAYAVAVISLAPGYRWGSWLGYAIASFLTVGGAIFHPWWSAGVEAQFLLLLVWAAALGLRLRVTLPLAAGAACLAFLLNGVTLAPYGLHNNFDHPSAVNLFDYLATIGSPLVGAALLFGFYFALFGDRFFLHRMRQLCRVDPRRQTPLELAAAALAAGTFEPYLLMSGFIMLLAATGLLLRDAVLEDL